MELKALSPSASLLAALLHLHCLCVTTFAFVGVATQIQRRTGGPSVLVKASTSESSILPTANSISIDNEDDVEQPSSSSSCRVLLLDHLNINHEKGRQDVAKAFYFDFLGCSIDPRKYDNYLLGKKTVWANIGMHQFHLPEGEPKAQVFQGMITILHSNLDVLMERYNRYLDGELAPLQNTEFLVGMLDNEMMLVTDPFGNEFCILPSDDPIEDRAANIGSQPTLDGHVESEGLAMEDITVYVPHTANLDGISRFYEYVFGAPALEELSSLESNSISIAMGERQTLTFQYHPDGMDADDEVEHHEFRFDDEENDGDSSSDYTTIQPFYPSNYGPHISLYVSNLSHAYKQAEKLNVLYVNRRFKRQAYTLDEAIDQCMFRVLDIIDPLDENKKVILRLEHEVRSTTTRDGRKYKSCPLLDVSGVN